LLLAAIVGALPGFQREHLGIPAGLRTHILVSMGSAIFILAAVDAGATVAETTRVIQGLATGIGFIGGGAILRSGLTVKGMTTAATIWVNAAIGMAAGAGEFATATATAVLTLVVLAVLPPIEDYFERRAGIAFSQDRNGTPR
jgi:putative Mg2+ transporter-C (MgtC) family protein